MTASETEAQSAKGADMRVQPKRLRRWEREQTPNEKRFPWFTTPQADSLAVIEDAGLLEYCSPSVGSITFCVKLRQAWDADGIAFICRVREVHRVASEIRDYTRICAY